MTEIPERLRTQEVLEIADMIMVTSSPNGVVNAAEGTLAFDTVANNLYVNTDGATAWAQIFTSGTPLERSWSWQSPAGSGTYYVAGYYEFGATANNFAPALNWGTANASYAAHFFIVTGAVPGANVTIRVTGTSITDLGVRTPGDTEDIVIPAGTPVNSYFEYKKWLGQVQISVVAGAPISCNYGWCKYWDNANTDFIVTAFEAVWYGNANDATPNILLRHHKTTGWTYNAAAPPTPPASMADMNTDHVVEIQVRNNEYGAWKRTNIATAVNGSGPEGVIIEMLTTANAAFDFINFILTTTQ